MLKGKQETTDYMYINALHMKPKSKLFYNFLSLFSIKKHIVLKNLGRIVIADCSYLSFADLDVSELFRIWF